MLKKSGFLPGWGVKGLVLLAMSGFCSARQQLDTVVAEKKRSVAEFQIATFSADVTIPLNHRCMGVLPTKSRKILDPLLAKGFVLFGKGKPIVFCAIDWCEIRNGSYDQWRNVLAEAAGTSPVHVLVAALHQHDAPVVDRGAGALLKSVGLEDELYQERFHQETLKRVAKAVSYSLEEKIRVTHLATGKARVDRIASNRRVLLPNRQVTFSRGSASGRNEALSSAPEGTIDPFLRTLSFWNQDTAILAMHSYATHPMSFYGRGEVSSDFVGLAREKLQREDFSVQQIYFSGCSGDVTAGKYNDGSRENRKVLADRLHRAMKKSWESQETIPITKMDFRSENLLLPYRQSDSLTRISLQQTLGDEELPTEKRILAAMGLSSLNRVESKQPIHFPVVDFGAAKIVLFPAEAFVGYQLMAQEIAGDQFVFSIGYGECWPGYIPTLSAFQDGFDDQWLWVDPGCEQLIRKSLTELLINK